MKQSIVKENLKQTERGYDLIAEKFSETRKHFWRRLEFIERYTRDGDKVLDFGCGNGRLLELFVDKNVKYCGVDISQKLLDLAKKRYPDKRDNFVKINPDKIRLPFNDENFNSIYSIATFHHLPGELHRLKIAKELYRVTKRGGRIVITVWDLWQWQYRYNIFKNWFYKIIGQSKLDWNDCRIAFTDNKGKVFSRYHHAFTKGELERLFKRAGFNIVNVERIGGNIVLVGQRD